MSLLHRAIRLLLLLPLLASACGTSELDEVARFDGDWVVETLITDGVEIDLGSTTIVLSIKTIEAAVSGSTGCHQIFGSYTLVDALPDPDEPGSDGASGAASFTMPGVSTNDCEDAELDKEQALLTTMESITQWRQVEPDLVFTRPTDPEASRSILVLRPAG